MTISLRTRTKRHSRMPERMWITSFGQVCSSTAAGSTAPVVTSKFTFVTGVTCTLEKARVTCVRCSVDRFVTEVLPVVVLREFVPSAVPRLPAPEPCAALPRLPLPEPCAVPVFELPDPWPCAVPVFEPPDDPCALVPPLVPLEPWAEVPPDVPPLVPPWADVPPVELEPLVPEFIVPPELLPELPLVWAKLAATPRDRAAAATVEMRA